jgi:hypothetical protein
LLWTDPSGLDVWGDIGAGMLAFGAGVLDDLTFGASSAILGAVIPGYDCFTQTNPWFAAGQMTSAIVSTALLVATGVGAVVAAAKLVAKIGFKAAMKAGAATIKATVRSAVRSIKSLVAAGGSTAHQAASTVKGLVAGGKQASAVNEGRRSVAIGEDMTNRVEPFAEKIGADTYHADPTAPREMWMKNNRDWIRKQMDDGCFIYDSGPAPGRSNFPNPTSPYYQMELEQIGLRNYPFFVRIWLE